MIIGTATGVLVPVIIMHHCRRNPSGRAFSTGWAAPPPRTYQTTIHEGQADRRQAKRLRVAEPAHLELAKAKPSQECDTEPTVPALLDEHESDYEDEDAGEAPPPGARTARRQRQTNTVSHLTAFDAQR